MNVGKIRWSSNVRACLSKSVMIKNKFLYYMCLKSYLITVKSVIHMLSVKDKFWIKEKKRIETTIEFIWKGVYFGIYNYCREIC